MLNNLDGDFCVTEEEIVQSNKRALFGPFIKTSLLAKEKGVSDQKEKKGEVVFKLFGIIPIKKMIVTMLDDDDYYLGGSLIGLSINADGAIVVDKEKDSLAKGVKDGDIITEIDGEKIESLNDIPKMLQNAGSDVELSLLRGNKIVRSKVGTYYDGERLKLGLWVKDDIAGVGTLSFVNTKKLNYGALGHAIVETEGKNIVPVSNGKIYSCELIGINKGKKNAPGELRCVFSEKDKSKGNIDSNTKFGIKGQINDLDGLVDENKTAKLGGRLSVKPGKAKIISSVSGINEEYDIEIIKANYQKSANDKSIVFRVKDKRLINLTGGIVQGMSGSPIIQDGKIVGVVTHVFNSDATKGYGVYVDWML